MKKYFGLLLVLVFTGMIFFQGCSSAPVRTVERIERDAVVDLSGKWNDTDARLVAENMVDDIIKRPWLTDFIAANGNKPVLIVGKIRNKSSEHIAIDVFTKDIERELLNSGRVKFVASKDEREQIREERKDQNDFASAESFKKFYRELGADFMLSGEINSVSDAIDGQKVILYKVDLQLIDIETNSKVWIGTKDIKKFIGQSGYKL